VFLDLDFTKLLLLGVVALLVFGPERLPGLAAQAGRALRELRRMAEGAKSELQDNLGPEFSNFDISDLNPKQFVRKHLVDELTGDGPLLGRMTDNGNMTNGRVANGGGTNGSVTNGSVTGGVVGGLLAPMAALAPGESPPYDVEAT
jgi:sec-independent protein translocase protein TatB